MSKAANSSRTILVLGNYRPSLTVIRKLSEAGHRVIVGRAGPQEWNCSVHWSRHVHDPCWYHPAWSEGPQAMLGPLLARLNQDPVIDAIFPVHENALLCLNQIREQIPTCLVMPPREVVDDFLDKGRTYDLCERTGIPQPRHGVAGTYEDLLQVTDSIGWPCVVKPIASTLPLPGDKKAIVCSSPESLAEQLPAWPYGHERLVVQQSIGGSRHNVYFAAHDGELVGAVQIKTGRTNRADGTGLAVEGQSVPLESQLHENVSALLSATNYHGVGCAQFLVDPQSGSFYFLELNPRLGANYAIVEVCGFPLTCLALDLASGGDLADRSPWKMASQKSFAWIRGDVAGCVYELRRREIDFRQAARWALQAIRSGVTADSHITWSWRDPLPTLVEFIRPLWRPRAKPRATQASWSSVQATSDGKL